MSVPVTHPGPPVDPNEIAPVCQPCNGRGCVECDDRGYFASVNARARFHAFMGAAIRRHPRYVEPIRYLEVA